MSDRQREAAWEPDGTILFVTGKGGVGKSTIAAALARRYADRDGRALLVEIEGASGAARALQGQSNGVTVAVVDYIDALSHTLAAMLNSKLLAKVVVAQKALRRVLDAVPAVRELVVLEKLRALAEEHRGARVIVDLPSTGHAVDWLRVPFAALRFLRSGPAARMCQQIIDQVLTRERSDIVVVSTAEPVVASETRELCGRLNEELGRQPAGIVVNRVPRAPSPQELAAAKERAEADPAFAPLRDLIQRDTQLSASTAEALRELSQVAGAPMFQVPELFDDPSPTALLPYLVDPG